MTDVVAPAELPPRVGDDEGLPPSAAGSRDEASLKESLRTGGSRTVLVLSGLAVVDAADNAAFGILAPDIQDSLGLSTTVITVVAALAGFTVFLAALPLGLLGDRMRRTVIAGISTLVWAGASVLTSVAQGAFQLVVIRILSGLGKANEGPIQGALLADAYPPRGRGKIFAIHRAGTPIGIMVGPALLGGVASYAGGPDGWRWAFLVMAVPAVLLGIATLLLPEPRRGRFEQEEVLGQGITSSSEQVAVTLEAAFARLKKVQTFYMIMVSLGAFGFAITTVPIYLALILESEFGLAVGERGAVASLTSVGAFIGAIIGGKYADRLFARSPEQCMYIAGGALASLGIGLGLQAYAPNVTAFVVIGFVTQGLLYAGLVPVTLVVSAITPFQFRAVGFAIVGLYLSLVGGLGGAFLGSAFEGRFGPQVAVAVLAPLASLAAAGFLARGARTVRADIAQAAADIAEEQAERDRVAAGGEQPLLQVRHLDFSYGSLQVLFDVSLDVREGEVLALLGTNGAGKSTLLRAVSGLDYADRGVIRLGGRTITYAEPGARVALGVVQVPGGKAVYPSLSVADNLLAGGYTLISDPPELTHRIEEVLELFPALRALLDQPAGTLSGGEQQILGLATAMILRPRILLIDELSLGLAPVMVQQVLQTVERLKATGLTMVIVEQSVNIALSIADRAVFMEKGSVRFEGPAQELLDRDDLVRAVFLGSDGG
jgi:ABC-type branched-subunit amino acid transport system ATPase component/predicted MFS family arabinose efflux permease